MAKESGLGFDIASVETWRQRMNVLQSNYALDQPLVVVVGSGLSLDREYGTGVADVGTLVDWIRAEGIQVPTGSDQEQYQLAMKALKAQRGARAVSLLIRRAILEAYRGSSSLVQTALSAPSEAQRNACRQLEQDLDDWPLPRGVYRLAHWLQTIVGERQKRPNPSVGPIHVVTTNFDPLVEIALKRFRVAVVAHSIPHDANPTVAACQVCVWHVHGAWWDVTLHSPAALDAHRNVLERVLQNWMHDAQICILGYGGWQDVVSTTVADTLGTFFGGAEILWAFFEDNDRKIQDKYRDPLERLASAPAFSQTTLFRGVDLHAASFGGDPDVIAALPNAVTAGQPYDTRISNERLERLRLAVAELLEIAPKNAQSKLRRLLELGGNLPDLCQVVAELCLALRSISARDPRRHFARAVLDVVSALSACVLEIGPREAAPGTENGDALVVESSLIAELRMAAEHQRALRLKTNDTGVVPTDAVDDCDLSRPLESGPADDDWVEAFQRRFWAMDHPHIDFDKQKHEAKLDGLLEGKKLLHEERFAVTESDVPVGALRQKIPHARFFIRGTSGSMSPAIREHTLATLIQELLKHAPELSPDVAPTKEPLR